jgi:hypothetical protein
MPDIASSHFNAAVTRADRHGAGFARARVVRSSYDVN